MFIGFLFVDFISLFYYFIFVCSFVIVVVVLIDLDSCCFVARLPVLSVHFFVCLVVYLLVLSACSICLFYLLVLSY